MTADPFSTTPGAAPGGAFVRWHQMGKGGPKRKRTYAPGTDQEQQRTTQGRLLLIKKGPVEVIPPKKAGDKPTHRMTADVVVLDGETITEVVDARTGEAVADLPEPLVPASKNAEVKGLYISGYRIVKQIEAAESEWVLGIVGRLEGKGENAPPYVLLAPTPEEITAARQWWDNVRPDPFSS